MPSASIRIQEFGVNGAPAPRIKPLPSKPITSDAPLSAAVFKKFRREVIMAFSASSDRRLDGSPYAFADRFRSDTLNRTSLRQCLRQLGSVLILTAHRRS